MEIRKYQTGGEMPVSTSAPAQQGGQDVIMQIADMFMKGLQSGDCNMLAQGAETFLMLLQQAGGQNQPTISAVPEGQPIFKKGGKMVKRVKKSCK